jgi:hypothetical protein
MASDSKMNDQAEQAQPVDLFELLHQRYEAKACEDLGAPPGPLGRTCILNFIASCRQQLRADLIRGYGQSGSTMIVILDDGRQLPLFEPAQAEPTGATDFPVTRPRETWTPGGMSGRIDGTRGITG